MAEQEDPAEGVADEVAADATATAVAVALALGGKGRGPKTDDRLDVLLEKLGRMLDLQMEGLQTGQALQSSDRRLRHRNLVLKDFGDRLRIGLQLLAIGFGLVVVIVLAAMVWQAREDHGLVIEAFSVPPDLASQGLTGQVVAARLLDKLQVMQKETESERPADSYQNDWGSQIKVEIPQTGLTFDEFERLLKAKLGHASHLTGEVFHTGADIAVTARLGDQPPQTFTGPPGELDALTQKAAEAVYRTSQPYRFTEFLAEHGRNAEAYSVISDLATNGPRSERGWAYAAWGYLDLNVNGDVGAARKHWLRSLAFPGAQFLAYAGLLNLEDWEGHDERVLQDSRLAGVAFKANHRDMRKDVLADSAAVLAGDLAFRRGDYLESARLNLQAAKTADVRGSAGFAPAVAATALALNHDPAAARSAIALLAPNDDVSLLQADAEGGFNALPAYAIAADNKDWRAALADARACDAWLEARKPSQRLMALVQQTWIRPLEALALAKAGDLAGAEALIATTPADCYLCVRVRGQIASARKDWLAGDHWFTKGAGQAPSLPFAYSDWGEMLLAKGDLAGAIGKFQIAHAKGPRFADPLKGWGDALARQGKWNDALAKYDEALKDAPAWPELRQARDAASRRVA
jgi:tetratricopeptide (TPR) repeat protein